MQEDFSSRIPSLSVAKQDFLLRFTARFAYPPPLHASTVGSIKPAQRSEAISRHSTGTKPREAAQADPATSADSK